MLRILLGYAGHGTEDAPTVLYAGHDGDAAEQAANQAGPEFVRLTRIDGAVERTARRVPVAGNIQHSTSNIQHPSDAPQATGLGGSGKKDKKKAED